mmetsp:Transcript_75964/g.210950  ORF Transcript_75964/g.210950 Transcript_75964/m.210950 type:complete len:225 (-) Transcript_75964:985-1659(-)
MLKRGRPPKPKNRGTATAQAVMQTLHKEAQRIKSTDTTKGKTKRPAKAARQAQDHQESASTPPDKGEVALPEDPTSHVQNDGPAGRKRPRRTSASAKRRRTLAFSDQLSNSDTRTSTDGSGEPLSTAARRIDQGSNRALAANACSKPSVASSLCNRPRARRSAAAAVLASPAASAAVRSEVMTTARLYAAASMPRTLMAPISPIKSLRSSMASTPPATTSSGAC